MLSGLRSYGDQKRVSAPSHAACGSEREQPVDHAALQVGQMAVDAHGAPEVGEPLSRVLGAAAPSPSATSAALTAPAEVPADALDLEPAIGQDLVEHAPGEGAVRAAALQREVDALARPLRPQPPDHRPAAVRPGGGGKQLLQENRKHSRIDLRR